MLIFFFMLCISECVLIFFHASSTGLLRYCRYGRSSKTQQLIGSNYAHWKARTKVYLQVQGSKVWGTVVKGWKHPTRVKEDKTKELTSEDTLTTKENVDFEFNNKSLNTIMGSLDQS